MKTSSRTTPGTGSPTVGPSSEKAPSAPVFLSYRRSDSEATVGRIADQLASRYGRDAVFRDVDSILGGQDFLRVIERAIEHSEVVVVAIGPRWLADAPGDARRLYKPDDVVRREIEWALRAGKTLLPLLIDGAQMPSPLALPQSIREISSLHALKVRADGDFKPDMERLIQALEANTRELRALRETQAQERVAVPLVVGATSFIVGLGLLWLMLLHAPELVRLGLTGNVWYVLLLALGLSASVVLFALFKSYARYTGRALNGTLELGGPTVVMLVVIGLGFYLVPVPLQRFDFTVFLHGQAGRQAAILRGNGKLSLDLGADRRTESIGDKGEVRFVGIPSDLRGRKVPVSLEADKYELLDPNLLAPLNQEAFYAAIRKRPANPS